MLYTLNKPFKFGSETITEIDIKEDYDAGDMARIQNAANKGNGDMFLELVCIGTGFALPKASKIPLKDSVNISKKVRDFLDLGESAENT